MKFCIRIDFLSTKILNIGSFLTENVFVLYPKFLKGRGAGKGNFFQKVSLPPIICPAKNAPENYSIKAVSLPVGSKVSSLCTKYSVMSKFFGRSVGV